MKCPRCQHDNPSQAKFCLECGSPMAARGGGEERKVVTVLFADLVGFTGRSEGMDVEDVRGTLAPYHALLRDQLEHYGGTVEKYIGDAVMAFWAPPFSAGDDHAASACLAALAHRDAVIALRPELPQLLGLRRLGLGERLRELA